MIHADSSLVMNRFILLLGALAVSAGAALGATTAGIIAKDET